MELLVVYHVKPVVLMQSQLKDALMQMDLLCVLVMLGTMEMAFLAQLV
jgi:hypothetical protein